MKKTPKEIMADKSLEVIKKVEDKKSKKPQRNAILEIDEIINSLEKTKGIFISENDFVINFCIHLNRKYGDSWSIEAEKFDDNQRTDILVRKLFPSGDEVKYFFEFKYQRGVLNVTDGLTGLEHSLNSTAISSGEIGFDIHKLQQAKKKSGDKNCYFYFILVSSVSKSHPGFDMTNIKQSVDTYNTEFPLYPIKSDFNVVHTFTLDPLQSDRKGKLVNKPFHVTVVKV